MELKLPGVRAQVPRLGAAFSINRPRLLGSLEPSQPRRRRIWEISNNFHCSIIGTRLTTAELRHILVKIALPGAHKETDHQLHGRAVLLAGQRDVASKLLQKALDRRHRQVIDRFGKARTPDELRALWDAAVARAEIPGAYWAVLTHPEATEELVRHAFGEVHMLSHLVGAANRADIRRLRELEAENAALQEKVARQQGQLRDAVVSREATIARLNEMLGKALSARHREQDSAETADDAELAAAAQVVASLQRRLASEIMRREKAERRLLRVVAERDADRKQRGALERQVHELSEEAQAADMALARLLPAAEDATASPQSAPADLKGVTLLYVGGRAHQMGQLRRLAERWSATFLHHDGGIDDRGGLLEAQVARADRTLFPVDCVSHNAVAVIKRVARALGRPYMPLRGTGLASFVAALRSIAQEERLGADAGSLTPP